MDIYVPVALFGFRSFFQHFKTFSYMRFYWSPSFCLVYHKKQTFCDNHSVVLHVYFILVQSSWLFSQKKLYVITHRSIETVRQS